MGFFNKVKQMAGFDGVKLDVDVPLVIAKGQNVISGKVRINCKESQSFQWIKVELQRKEGNSSVSFGSDSRDDRNDTVTWIAVSDYVMEQPFSMADGETREFDFQMVAGSDDGKGLVDAMEGMEGIAGGIGKFLGAMDNRVDYRIEAKANVDGVTFDPTKSVRVAFE